MNVKDAQQILRNVCGINLVADGDMGPKTRAAIKTFQLGYAFGATALKVTGELNAKTVKALKHTKETDGKVSPNFRWKEFTSNGDGDVFLYRKLLKGLEELRRTTGKPIVILSGYRDPAYNKKIGGATYSQHVVGCAIDPSASGIRLSEAKKVRRFSGIGYQLGTGSDPLVRHLDVRHAGPWNFTKGTPLNPTVWSY